MTRIENLFKAADFSRETNFKEELSRTLFGKTTFSKKLTDAEMFLVNAAGDINTEINTSKPLDD